MKSELNSIFWWDDSLLMKSELSSFILTSRMKNCDSSWTNCKPHPEVWQEDGVTGGFVALRVQHLRQPQRAADPQVQFHWKATGGFLPRILTKYNLIFLRGHITYYDIVNFTQQLTFWENVFLFRHIIRHFGNIQISQITKKYGWVWVW